MSYDPSRDICRILGLPPKGVAAAVRLFGEGATVPFIARYRKEVTGGLDEVALRSILEQRTKLLELDKRRQTVLAELDKQGVRDPELRARIEACVDRTELEDMYAPYRPKRKTRASAAREQGLSPLAIAMWKQPRGTDPAAFARQFLRDHREVKIADVDQALAGARDICAEQLADRADARKLVRDTLDQHAMVEATKTKDHKDRSTKFDGYDKLRERWARFAGHRLLALRRGENEGVLRSKLTYDEERTARDLGRLIPIHRGSAWAGELDAVVSDALKRLVGPSAETAVRKAAEQRAEEEAAEVFARNLEQLLLAAPFGDAIVLGIDPGQRTGCKCAVIDATGTLLEHATFNLVQGAKAEASAKETVRRLCTKHRVAAVAVGNGTHGRETLRFVRDVLTEEGREGIVCAPVNEAGASIYSASDIAREELPELDVSVRGAVSIARRMQDPLAELVKIDPESIGVGQYQHDIAKPLLRGKLSDVVESCVNRVGVDLNTASAPLLAHVAGIGSTLAKRITEHRTKRGAFRKRSELLEVSGLGPKAFEQAAGFLRIRGGPEPLDASAVHPERYELVRAMARSVGKPVGELVGNPEAARAIDKAAFRSSDVGDYTLDDILGELAKPGRDPRRAFEAPAFRDDVRTLDDLEEGMRLEGVVTNVTAFGAFVDVGVHQDGLVHVSQLADRFVRDPTEIVKVGDRLSVRVLGVDRARKRISLSAKG